MTSSAGRGFFSYRIPARILVSAIFIACLSGAAPQAHAQEDDAPAWTLKRLFGSRKIEPAAPEPAESAAPAARKNPRVSREPTEAPSSVAVKRPDAKNVLVIGDFLGGGLAEGLSTAFVENPHVRIVDRTNGSSGFVRDDFYDWPARIGGLIDAENPAAVVIMLGANDRQQMLVDGTREPVRSQAWVKAYAERTQALAKAIGDRKVPFIWVGVPSFKSSKMLLDMLAFNEIFKGAAAAAGGQFVDIWDGFVDEDGVYVANGPDLNGQPARLRAADGINLARPGKRKLAFYAEKPLGKLLGDAVTAPALVNDALAVAPSEASFIGPVLAPPPEEAELVIGPSDLGPIEPGVPVSLRSPALDGGTELLGLVAEPRQDATTTGDKLMIEGVASVATPGRADDFSWSLVGATVFASAIAPAEPTTGKGAVPAILASLVLPSPPTAPAPMIATAAFVAAPAAAPPTTSSPAPEEVSLPEARMPVMALAPAGPPQEDRTVAAKARVFLAPPGSTGDKSPSRASPTASPETPLSSGPAAEGAPTALPPASIDLPPVQMDRPVAAHTAPTIIALGPATAEPTGARTPAPRILRLAKGDAAPRPSAAPEVVVAAASSGPPASAVPLAPDTPAEDRAPAGPRVGRVASAGIAPTIGRRDAPTDPAKAAIGDLSPYRSAPAIASDPPVDLLAAYTQKEPPALLGRLDQPAPAAPAMLIATLHGIDDNFSSIPAIPTPRNAAPGPKVQPAPTTLPESDQNLAPSQIDAPPLAAPPATGLAPPLAAAPTAGPAALSVPAVDTAPEREVDGVIASPRPQAPMQPAPPTPASAPNVEPALPMTQMAGPSDDAQPTAEAEPYAPVAVPEIDIALLEAVPPDLMPAAPAKIESVPESALPVEDASPIAEAEPEPESEATDQAALQPVEPEPELPTVPVTAPGEEKPVAAQPSPVEDASPMVDGEPVDVPETDVALLEAVPPDLMPGTPAKVESAPEPAAPVSALDEEAQATAQPEPVEVAPPVAKAEPVAPVPPDLMPAAPAKIESAPEPAAAPQPAPVEDAQPVIEAEGSPPLEAPTPVAEIKPDAPITVPEIDVALLDTVPPDLMPAAPAKVESAPQPAAAPQPAPVEDAQPVIEAVQTPPLEAAVPADETKPDAPIAIPEIDVALLDTVPPDLMPAAPAKLESAPEPAAAPQPAPVEDAQPVIEAVETPLLEAPAPVAETKPDAPIAIPEIDVALLDTVPPDLMPAAPAKVESAPEPAAPVSALGEEVPATAQPEPVEVAPPVVDAKPDAPEPASPVESEAQPAVPAISAPKPEGEVTDQAALQPIEPEPDLPTAPAPDDETPAAAQPAPVEDAQPVIEAVETPPLEAPVPTDETKPDAPIAVPEIDVALLEAVPPDLKPATPVKVESAPGPTPPLESGAQSAVSAKPEVQPEALVEGQPPADAARDVIAPRRDRPIVVPEIDVSMLQTVPPDLMSRPAPKTIEAQANRTGEGDTPITGFTVFDSVDQIPPPRIDGPTEMPTAP